MYVYVNVHITSVAIKKINLFLSLEVLGNFGQNLKNLKNISYQKKNSKKDCIKKSQEQSIKDQSKNYT